MILLLAFQGLGHAQTRAVRRVLVLTEAGPASPVIAAISAGMREVLNPSQYQIEIYQESFEAILFPDVDTQREFRDWLRRKYRQRSPDLIVAIGPTPLSFLLEHRRDFFPQVPVIFCVVTPDQIEANSLDPQITGIWQDWQPAKTLDAALRLQPSIRHVVVIGGTAAFDRHFVSVVRDRLGDYTPKLDFIYLTDLAMPELLDRVAHLPPQTIILYTSLAQDAAGEHFLAATQSGPMIARAANAPVFTLNDVNLDHGEAGGYVVSFAAVGQEVGAKALRIFHGKRPQDIAVSVSPNVYMFDWRALQRWELNEQDVPPGSVLINHQPDIFEAYGRYLAVGLLLFVAQASIIVGLVWQRKRKRIAQAKLLDATERLNRAMDAGRESEDKLRLLLDSTAEGIFGVDLEARCTFCNSATLRILGYETADQLLGKNMHELIHHSRPNGSSYAAEDCPILKVLHTGRSATSQDEVLWKADGSSFPAEYWSNPQWKDGRVVGAVVAFIDITRRHRARMALQQSEDKFSKTFQDAPVAVTLVRARDDTFVDVNHTFELMTGYCREEVIGRTPLELNLLPDPGKRTAIISRLRAEGWVPDIETQFRTKDGSIRAGLASSRTIDIDGEPHILSAAVDVTERNRIADQLQQSELKFRTVFQDAPEAMALIALDGKYLAVNKALCDFLGYTEEELLRTSAVAVTHPDDRDATVERLRSVETRPALRIEKRYLHKNGEVRWGDLSRSVVCDPRGNPSFFVSQVLDITGRKRMEEELRRRQWDLNEAQRVAGVGGWTRDRNDVLTWSEEMYRIHGRDPSLGPPSFQELSQLFTPQSWERVRNTRESAWSQGFIPNEDLEIVGPDGTHRWISARGDVECDEAGTPIVVRGTAQDITERKLAEQKLREYEAAVEGAQEMITVIDREYRYVIANRAFLDTRRKTREEVVGRPVWEVLDSREFFESAVKPQIDECFEGKSLSSEVNYTCPERGVRDLAVSYFPIDFPTGVRRVVCIVQDVTEHKRLDHELRQSESALRQAQRIAEVGSWTLDPHTGACTWSDELIAMIGWDPKQPIPTYREHEQFFDAESWRKLNEAVQKTLATGEPYEVDTEGIRPDGTTGWFMNRGELVRNSRGEIESLRGTVQNITQRRLAEHAVRDSEERYRSLVESSHDWVWEVDAQARYTHAGPQCRQILGYEPAEMLGKTPFDFMPPLEAARVAELFRTIAKQRKPFRLLENINLHKDGREVILETNGSPITDEEDNFLGYRGMDRNITERKRAEQALVQSERKFVTLFRTAPVAIGLNSLDGKFVDVNDAFETVTGYTRDEAIGHTALELNLWVDPTIRQETMAKLREEGRVRDVEYKFHHKSGRVRTGLLSSEKIEVAGETYTLTVVKDLTEQKLAEESLRESEERFRRVVEHISDALLVDDVEGRVVFANDQFLNLFGFRREDLYRLQLEDYVVPEYRTELRDRHERRMRGESVPNHFEYEGCRCDGLRMWLEVDVVPIQDRNGRWCGTQSALRNITSRKQAEIALRESEERFRNIANSAPVMIWILDLEGRCTYVNKTWLDFTGRLLESQLGPGWLNGTHPDDLARCKAELSRALEHHESFRIDYRLRRHDGQYRWVIDTGVPRFDSSGAFAGYIGSCIDDTERRRGEEALRSVSAKLIEAQERERKRIARELHDDINQRLAMVAIQLEQLQTASPSAARKEQLLKLFNETTKVSSDIQALSHELHSASLDFLGLVPALRGFCDEMRKRQKVTIDFVADGVPKTLSPEITVALFRVAQEALHNAVKYSGVRHFEVHLRGSDSTLELTVKDSGVGFGPEGAMEGRGLGLISMRERIVPLKGTISIVSKPQQGTEISVRVPVPKPN